MKEPTISFDGHNAHIPSVVFSPKGDCIATGYWDETVKLWPITLPETN